MSAVYIFGGQELFMAVICADSFYYSCVSREKTFAAPDADPVPYSAAPKVFIPCAEAIILRDRINGRYDPQIASFKAAPRFFRMPCAFSDKMI